MNRGFYLFLLTAFLKVSSFAQTGYTIYPNDTLIENAKTDFINVYDIYQKNNSSKDSLVIGYERLSVTFPSGWDYSLCVYGTCFTGLPEKGEMNPIPPDEDGFFGLNVNPSGISGSGAIRYKLYNTKNPSQYDIITWIVSYGTNGLKMAKSNLKIYPNSVEAELNIVQDYEMFNTMKIIDASGKEIKNQEISVINQIDLSKFNKGLYFLILSNGSQDSYVTRIVKQ